MSSSFPLGWRPSERLLPAGLTTLSLWVLNQAASPALSGTLPPCREALLSIMVTVAVLFLGLCPPPPPSSRQSSLGLGNREQRDDGRWRSLSGKYSKEGVCCSVYNKYIQAGTIQRFVLRRAEVKRNQAPDSNINVKRGEILMAGERKNHSQ